MIYACNPRLCSNRQTFYIFPPTGYYAEDELRRQAAANGSVIGSNTLPADWPPPPRVKGSDLNHKSNVTQNKNDTDAHKKSSKGSVGLLSKLSYVGPFVMGVGGENTLICLYLSLYSA